MNQNLRSSIDLGTNTCLLLIAECETVRGRPLRMIRDFAQVVRLGQGVDRARLLQPEAMERTLACLTQYSREIKLLGLEPKDTVCVATSQARDAQNGADFFLRIEKLTGFKFRILSGEDEALCTFEGGLLPGMDPAQSVVIDIGGGSTELMSRLGGQSLDIGSVRFTERYLTSNPVTDQEFWACQAEIDHLLKSLVDWRKALPLVPRLVGVAGTATTLAAWYLGLHQFDSSRIDQVTLTRGDVHRQVEELKWRSVKERRELPGVEEGRADVLLAGALILWRAMEVLDFLEIQISTRGLRYGILSRYQ